MENQSSVTSANLHGGSGAGKTPAAAPKRRRAPRIPKVATLARGVASAVTPAHSVSQPQPQQHQSTSIQPQQYHHLETQQQQQQQQQQQSTSSYSTLPMIRLCLGGEYIEVPRVLVENESVFRSVLTKSAFQSLPNAAQAYLKRFLPLPRVQQTEENSKSDSAAVAATAAICNEEDKILDAAFTADENFIFENPISKVFRKLKCGYFNGQHATDEAQLRSYRRVLYDHYIRNYYVQLLRRVLINRQIILENASKASSHEGIVLAHPVNSYSKRKLKRSKAISTRAKIRARRMIQECKAKVGEERNILSSDDEEDLSTTPIPLAPGAESSLYSKEFSSADLDLHQPIRNKDTKELIREYRHLCEVDPDCENCKISEIRLEEVYERAGVPFQSERNFAERTHQHGFYRNGNSGSISTSASTTGSMSLVSSTPIIPPHSNHSARTSTMPNN